LIGEVPIKGKEALPGLGEKLKQAI